MSSCSRLVVVVAALAALARGASADDVVVWYPYTVAEKVGFEQVVARYNAARGSDGPRVSAVAVPLDAIADKITAAVPRGRGPDVFVYPQDRLGGWVEAGNTVEPIDFLLDAATRARFFPIALQAMTYRGAVYGLPLNVKLLALYHNRRLVPEPPRTTADLEKVAARLTRRDAGTFGLAYVYDNYWWHAGLQHAFGGRAFDERNRPVLDSPENVRAMELMLRWRDEFLPLEPSSQLLRTLFNQGKAAMVFEGPWFRGEIEQEVAYGVAPLPAVSEAGGRPMRPWVTVDGLYVARPSRQKDAAWEFLKFATDLEAARIMAVVGTQAPAHQAVYADPALARDPVLRAFFAQAQVAVPMPNTAEMTVMWSPVTTAMGKIVRRSATPQAALQAAQAQVEKDLAKLRR